MTNTSQCSNNIYRYIQDLCSIAVDKNHIVVIDIVLFSSPSFSINLLSHMRQTSPHITLLLFFDQSVHYKQTEVFCHHIPVQQVAILRL